MRLNESAQTALVDSIIFMILMLLASGIILGSASNNDVNDSGLQQYAGDFGDTLLSIEVGNNSKAVTELLCDEAILGIQLNYSMTNEAILEAGDSLIRPGMGYAISCQDIFLSSYVDGIEELLNERQANQRILIVHDNQIEIIVYVWVIS